MRPTLATRLPPLACLLLIAATPRMGHAQAEYNPSLSPAEQWESNCNAVLGYVGCNNMMHGGPQPPGPPPKPDVWGAIAVSPTSLDRGTSATYPTKEGAADSAMAACRASGPKDCKIAILVADVCVSFVESFSTRKYFVGGPAGASNFSENNGNLQCTRSGATDCKLMDSFCADGGMRHVLAGNTVSSNGNPIFQVNNFQPRNQPGLHVGQRTSAAPAASVQVAAADDTARFYGTWTASIPVNGASVTLRSVHDQQGYHNTWVSAAGTADGGSGTFSAANGTYYTNAPQPNDTGTYRFTDANTVVCTNAAGVTVKYQRIAQLPTATSDYQAPERAPIDSRLRTFQTMPDAAPTKR
jgi:hypothetical protein